MTVEKLSTFESDFENNFFLAITLMFRLLNNTSETRNITTIYNNDGVESEKKVIIFRIIPIIAFTGNYTDIVC